MRSVAIERIVTVNPATEARLAEYATHSPAELDAMLDSSVRAQALWARRPVEERTRIAERIAQLLRRRRDGLARLATLEMGKPLREALAEVDKCARTCEYYVGAAAAGLADAGIETEARTWVSYEPLGTVLAIMPWNYPFWQVVRSAIPTLLAGNTVILKHAPATTGCALALHSLLAEAGVPEDVLSVAVVADERVDDVVAGLIADDRVQGVTITGSDAAGAAVGAAAGRAVKKAVLERGGSDAFVVLDDADVDRAARAAARSRFGNAGQSCVAAKRILVSAAAYERFVTTILDEVGALQIGDPLDVGTDLGPLARLDLLDRVDAQVRTSIDAGALVLAGARRRQGRGYFYLPTVLGSVTSAMAVASQEVFGPVAVLARIDSDEEAVEVANHSPWGLGASVWSGDLDRAKEVARRIASGLVAVNSAVASDPRLPFGGIRRSGYGRELAWEGLRAFTNVRSWWVEA